MDDDDEYDAVGASGPRRRYEDVREGVDDRLLPTVVPRLIYSRSTGGLGMTGSVTVILVDSVSPRKNSLKGYSSQ